MRPANCLPPYFHAPFFRNPVNLGSVFLTALVMAAGAATVGVAIAGYAPMWSIYPAQGLIAITTVIFSIFLAARSLHLQKAEGKKDQQLPEMAIFRRLFPRDRARAQQVYNQCCQVVTDPDAGKALLKTAQWCEDQPCIARVFLSTWCIGRTKPKEIIRPKEEIFTGTSCGNQFAFLDVQGGMEVWQLSSQSSDEQFALRTHRNFFNLRPSHFALDNETIYLADKNGDVQIWDLRTDLISTWTASDKKIGYIQITQDRIVTCSNKQFLIWNKENKNLLHRVPNGTYKSCILLGNFLYTHQKEHRLDTQSSQVAPWGNDFIYDLVLYRDEIITGSTQGEIKRWNPRTWKQETLAKHGVRIERMYVVGDLLIYQISKDFCVFDLQKKQLLQKTSLGNYHIKAALGGMVIASNKFEFKIFDYRIW